MYRNFDLEFESRYRAKGESGGGGLLFRAADPAGPRFELQLASKTGPGRVQGQAGAAGQKVDPAAAAVATVRPGGYTAYRLRAVGGRVAVWVNGVPALDQELDLPATGEFHWHLHAATDELRVKNVVFRDLSAAAHPDR